ncbi:MAG: hypothetical protein LW629_07785 [Burkholderiales bacterium]|nr:hypothetical protein [Burkholderiales bacterium]
MKGIREVMFNPIELGSLAKSGAFYWGLITPQLVLGLFIALYFCTQSVSRLIEAISKEQVEQSVEAGIALHVQSISAEELENIKKMMSYLNPEVEIKINTSAEPNQLIVSISKAESYNQFREALISVQSSLANAIWSSEEICIGKCNGAAASATLTAKTQTIKMKSY